MLIGRKLVVLCSTELLCENKVVQTKRLPLSSGLKLYLNIVHVCPSCKDDVVSFSKSLSWSNAIIRSSVKKTQKKIETLYFMQLLYKCVASVPNRMSSLTDVLLSSASIQHVMSVLEGDVSLNMIPFVTLGFLK